MNAFETVVAKDSSVIYGTTTINHNKRCKMGLSTGEYVVADFVAYANSKRKMVTFEYALARTGYHKDDFLGILKSLVSKGFVEIHEPTIEVTRKWLDTFMIEEQWFESFWLVNGQAIWPGSKPDAKEKFVKAATMFSPEFIIECRDRYLKFMAHPENNFRKIMGAPVFLNLKTERFKEDWLGQLRRLNGEIALPRKLEKPLTKAEKDKMFQ